VPEKQQKTRFSAQLLSWNSTQNNRVMPWKGIKDPYRIWLSEIILQQTRVDQGMAYYQAFIKHFPTIHALAQAEEGEVYKLWEGLGYYSRCRNLIYTAKVVSEQFHGQFPNTFEGLLSLKGIGAYTASAIGSFAFGLPRAVVDGNVLRVLSRIFGITLPIDQKEGRKYFDELAQELIDKNKPAAYNQAIMDFGATICTPQKPLCATCPYKKKCVALNQNKVSFFPVKSPKKKPRDRWFYYLVLQHKGCYLVGKREQKGIWQSLYEFILKEVEQNVTDKELKKFAFWEMEKYKLSSTNILLSEDIKHQLTHQTIHCKFVKITIDKKINIDGYTWVSKSEFQHFAFPRLITRYLESISGE
jgi:A/G-specific adenine glycosylase